MEMTYKVLLHEADYRAIYEAMREDDTLWSAWPDIDPDEWTPEIVVRLMSRPDVLVLGGAIDGVPAGFMTLHPVTQRTLTAEIGVAAFRPFFRQAAALCRGALLWACDNLELSSFLGKVAAPNRHVLAMLGQVGFYELGRVPGLFWYTRKQRFVDGVLVMATPESIRKISAEEA